jgi:hypothetical protein
LAACILQADDHVATGAGNVEQPAAIAEPGKGNVDRDPPADRLANRINPHVYHAIRASPFG